MFKPHQYAQYRLTHFTLDFVVRGVKNIFGERTVTDACHHAHRLPILCADGAFLRKCSTTHYKFPIR